MFIIQRKAVFFLPSIGYIQIRIQIEFHFRFDDGGIEMCSNKQAEAKAGRAREGECFYWQFCSVLCLRLGCCEML